ncbi:MAG: hypothetical protein HC828_17240 [Blastochloris sp.]|nr:hypothetical protein [Blastochloris sp.]
MNKNQKNKLILQALLTIGTMLLMWIGVPIVSQWLGIGTSELVALIAPFIILAAALFVIFVGVNRNSDKRKDERNESE